MTHLRPRIVARKVQCQSFRFFPLVYAGGSAYITGVQSSVAIVEGEASGFGELIRELRHARGWTQKQLAKRAAVTERTISNLERDANPRRYGATVAKVAVALGMTPEQLDARRLAESVVESATTFAKRDAISRLLSLPDEDVSKVLELVTRLQQRRAGRRRKR
jgi:transcriptional regulator with XRE-family HTH domain